jgi:putative membrane protein insertion efficiency factor
MKGMLLRELAVAPIRLYQYCISPFFPACCRHYPSCSAYAREAVIRHGIFRGGLLAFSRLSRCHPWGAGGYDPVPVGTASAHAPEPDKERAVGRV